MEGDKRHTSYQQFCCILWCVLLKKNGSLWISEPIRCNLAVLYHHSLLIATEDDSFILFSSIFPVLQFRGFSPSSSGAEYIPRFPLIYIDFERMRSGTYVYKYRKTVPLVDSVTERQKSSELPDKTRFFDIKGNMLDLLRIKGYYIKQHLAVKGLQLSLVSIIKKRKARRNSCY